MARGEEPTPLWFVDGWLQMSMPVTRRIFGPPQFARLASTHALCTAGDAFFTVSLAGSLFFNVSIGAARPRVIAYLALTLAPFVVLAPLVAPLIDHFGRARPAVLATTALGRGILCLFVAGDLRNVLLYPEAFGVLVLEKAYSVAKSALVPTLVREDADLVAANSRLARISTVAGLLAGAGAAALFALADATPVLRVASLAYFAAAIAAMRIPAEIAPMPARLLEHRQLQSPNVRFAAGVMSVLRGSIGFLVFLVAFGLKRAGEPTWFFGAVAAVSITGGLIGTFVGPRLRDRFRRDEVLLSSALVAAAVATLLVAVRPERVAVLAAVLVLACAASVARSGFDSILQRDAPDAARGRSFARFETLFQLFWVLGALAGVLFQPTTRHGLAALGVLFVVTLVVYVVGANRSQRFDAPPVAS
jgi:Na+/melibiose symporter-like transporter